MKTSRSLSDLPWKLIGWHPNHVLLANLSEAASPFYPDVGPISATVPGSVQQALLMAGILPDWFKGDSMRQCDWVENRDWVFETEIPGDWFDSKCDQTLRFDGLDGCGAIYVNGSRIGEFANSFLPHAFKLPAREDEAELTLRVLFTPPPRWLGQIGWTSKIRDWKPRFNYSWDWTPRLVQIGIYDDAALVSSDGQEFDALRCQAGLTAGRGWLHLTGKASGPGDAAICISLSAGGRVHRCEEISVAHFNERGLRWTDLAVEPWWPNPYGDQPLYDVQCELTSARGVEDRRDFRVGFKEVAWLPCENAPSGADPWLCQVNGEARLFVRRELESDPAELRRRAGGGLSPADCALRRDGFYPSADQRSVLS